MKRFAFRLESVLRIRTFEFDRARGQLARLEEERARRETLVRGEVERIAQGRILLAAETQQGADGEQLQLRNDALTAGRFRLAAAERAVAELIEPIGEARRRLHHARSRVRSLERLKEDAAATHQREGRAADQAELEELALSRIGLERIAAGRPAHSERRRPVAGEDAR
ncbi:MAG: hypothetical protein AAGC67_02735 [Myxococcota bacterium]